MTRDEAIAYGIECAECLVEMRRRGISPARHEIELAELAEAKAALAEPVMMPLCPRCNGSRVMFGCVDCDKWFETRDAKLARLARCQHQAADASLDCTEPAVLCEHHGGHDGCAISEQNAYMAGEIVGRGAVLEEIAQALETKAGELSGGSAQNTWLGLVAAKIRDGSIREWLPKDDRNAE